MPINPALIYNPFTNAETATLQSFADLAFQNGDIFYYNSGLKRLAKGTDTQVLTLASGIPSWADSSGGSGSPGGSNTQVQYNSSGSFAGAAGFVFDGTSKVTLGVAGTSLGKLVLSGSTSGTATIQTPVAAGTGTVITLPGATGTLATLAGTEAFTNKDLTGAGNSFPTFNQNTTGSAAKWTTARNLAGNSVDGSANVAFANKFIVQGTTDAGLSAAQFLGALGTGILKNTTTTGVLSIAVAADFPTLNQNTTGSAATLTTPRAIYGNNFDGSAALTQIIASTFGGTGNGFTKFSGPATSEKTFTLPNASATILTDNAAVTVAQGGTGQTTYTDGQILIGNTSTGGLSKATLSAGANITITNGNGTISIAATSGGGLTWNEVTTTTQTAAVGNGYIANNASLVTITLPSTAAQGSIIEVVGKGAGGWKIAQNSGQVIHFGNQNTTTGVGGSLSSILTYDAVRLLCTTANTEFTVISVIGNLNSL